MKKGTPLKTDYDEKPKPGTKAKLANQCCNDIDGKQGDFIFTGERPLFGHRYSPIFTDLGALYVWLKRNGWEQVNNSATVFIFDP